MAKMTKNQRGRGNRKGQFMGSAFELGRGGKKWFESSRPDTESWCHADVSPKKGMSEKNKSDKDGY